MLIVARVVDRWVPSSLDWHERLVRQLQDLVPEKRPPVLLHATVSLLDNYLYFHLNFHRLCASLSFSGVEKMAANLEELHRSLAKDLNSFTRFLEMHHASLGRFLCSEKYLLATSRETSA